MQTGEEGGDDGPGGAGRAVSGRRSRDLFPRAPLFSARPWRAIVAVMLCGLAAISMGATARAATSAVPHPPMADIAELRRLYAGPPESWPRPHLREGAVFTEFGPLPAVEHPADNPPSREKFLLGLRLFEDPILSRSRQIACASCHNRELGFTDGISRSFGHDRQRGRRNSQSLLTAAWMKALFWDGRSPVLEHQVLMPITDPIEMAASLPVIERRLNRVKDYRIAFAEVFGARKIRMDDVAKALAHYIRAVSLRPNTGWDKAMKEGTQALSDGQLRGLHLFRTKAGCANCHNGPLFTDQRFHNEGLHFYGRTNQDLGRYEITHKPADIGTFRTPSLRGISRTAPYMHNGGFPRLDNVVAFYNFGGAHPKPRPEQVNDPLFPKTTPLLAPLTLSAGERADIVAFLEAL